jgi:hypothetical protein
MSKKHDVKIKVLTRRKEYSSADAQDESKVIEVIQNSVLPKSKKDYYAIDVKVKRKEDQSPEYLVAYLKRKDIYLTEIVRVDVENDYGVKDTTWNYDSSEIDDEDEESEGDKEEEGYSGGYDFVVSTPVDDIVTAKGAVQDLHALFTSLGFNTKMLLGSTATVADYKQYLTSGLKGFVNIGHGNNSGISLHDGFLNATWFNSVANTAVKPAVVYFNSCQVFNEPLKSAVMQSGARTFIGGVINLLIGPSEKVCVCFWTKSLKTAKLLGMSANLNQCEIDNYPTQGAHGIIGDTGRFIQVKSIINDPGGVVTMKEVASDTIKEIIRDPISTIKEVRKDPIRDTTIKEIRKDPIIDPMPGIGRFRPQGNFGFASPFVTETPSRAPSVTEDQIAQTTAYVQELESALIQLDQQTRELMAAYEEAVATLEAMNQGQF